MKKELKSYLHMDNTHTIYRYCYFTPIIEELLFRHLIIHELGKN